MGNKSKAQREKEAEQAAQAEQAELQQELENKAEETMRKKGKGTCARCSAELGKNDIKCPKCYAPTEWKS
jgi:uncharacterized paraquat-inducible protein A